MPWNPSYLPKNKSLTELVSHARRSGDWSAQANFRGVVRFPRKPFAGIKPKSKTGSVPGPWLARRSAVSKGLDQNFLRELALTLNRITDKQLELADKLETSARC